MKLRLTTAADLPEVVGWEADPGTSVWLGVTGISWHARALADADQEHVVAVADGVAVGFAVLAGLGGAIELRRMVVAPAARGAGQGRELLRAVLDRAYTHHGARRVWLDVKPGNRHARALYESEGFTVTQTRTDLVFMERLSARWRRR